MNAEYYLEVVWMEKKKEVPHFFFIFCWVSEWKNDLVELSSGYQFLLSIKTLHWSMKTVSVLISTSCTVLTHPTNTDHGPKISACSQTVSKSVEHCGMGNICCIFISSQPRLALWTSACCTIKRTTLCTAPSIKQRYAVPLLPVQPF